jgi:ankyrin repeat protein
MIQDEDGYTALHHAVMNGRLRGVENVLKNVEHGSSEINCCAHDGMSPLHLAASKGNNAVVQKLLDHGADAKVCTSKNGSPLHIACLQNHEETVDLLMTWHANLCHSKLTELLNLRNADGETPLHIACIYGNFPIVSILLHHGARVNCVDHNHSTPLHYAVWSRKDELVSFLMENGADINLRSQFKFCPNKKDESACPDVDFILPIYVIVNYRTRYAAPLYVHEYTDRAYNEPAHVITMKTFWYVSCSDIYTPLHQACGVGMIDIWCPFS